MHAQSGYLNTVVKITGEDKEEREENTSSSALIEISWSNSIF